MTKKIRKSDIDKIIKAAQELLKNTSKTSEINGKTMYGWHNFFEDKKIGTTGTALPLLFFYNSNTKYENIDLALETLINLRKKDNKSDFSAWSILSVPNSLSIEGTILPIIALYTYYLPAYKDVIENTINWVKNIQQIDGGWNSNGNNVNQSRTLLTCNVLNALIKLKHLQTGEEVKKGITWIFNAQNKDGGWGATSNDKESNVIFTARVLFILKLYNSESNEVINKAIKYIKEAYNNDERYYSEIYDIHFKGGYNRVTLEHDIAAELLNLFSIAPNLFPPQFVFDTISKVIEYYDKNKFISPSSKKESIWTTVPIANSLYMVLNLYLPPTFDSWFLIVDRIIVSSEENISSTKKFLYSVLIKPYKLWILIFIVLLMLILYCLNILNFKETFIGIIFPIILFILNKKYP